MPQTKLQKIQAILGVKVDDAWGPVSQGALDEEIAESRERHKQDKKTNDPAKVLQGVDERSAKNILTLHPKARDAFSQLIEKAREAGYRPKITSAYRTYAEQAKLHDEYLNGGPVAAKAGYSNHNYAIAADFTIFEADERTPIWDGPDYDAVGKMGESLGLTWGGRWKGKGQDKPHLCKRPDWAKDLSESGMIDALRERKANGDDVFA